MIDAIAFIWSVTKHSTRVEYMADRRSRDAVALNLLVLGEGARSLSAETRAMAPDVQWPVLTSIRNRIAHEYRSFDHSIAWSIATERLPGLQERLTLLLEQINPADPSL